MTETIRFVDGINYTESTFADFIRRLRPEGILQDSPLGIIGVTSIGGFGMRVSPGDAFIQGFLYTNDANKDLTIGGNSSGSARVDTIVVRVNPTANTATAQVIVGTPGAGAPALTQVAGGTWDFPLADIAIANGAGSLSGANITDRRVYSLWPLTALPSTLATDAEVAAIQTTLQNNINSEASTRATADTTETTNRTNTDNIINTRLTSLEAARVRAAGVCNSAGGILWSVGVSTVVRNAAGWYVVTFSPALATTSSAMFAVPMGGVVGYTASTQITTTTTGHVFINSYSAGQNPTDDTFGFVVIGP